MDLTLDEYLRQVVQWKQTVADRMAKLNPAERAAEDRDALVWLEAKLGRRLQDSPAAKTQETPRTPRPA